jgi:tRNA-dihydrouridine synthase
MIARGGSGKPWLYQQLLSSDDSFSPVNSNIRLNCFLTHLQGLAQLENEHQAVLQSKSLVRYYFRDIFTPQQLQDFYALSSLTEIEKYCGTICRCH